MWRGRTLSWPWQTDELRRVFSALTRFQTLVTPCPIPALPTVVERHQGTFDGWRLLRDDPPTELDPWSRRPLNRLAEREVVAQLQCHFAASRRSGAALD